MRHGISLDQSGSCGSFAVITLVRPAGKGFETQTTGPDVVSAFEQSGCSLIHFKDHRGDYRLDATSAIFGEQVALRQQDVVAIAVSVYKYEPVAPEHKSERTRQLWSEMEHLDEQLCTRHVEERAAIAERRKAGGDPVELDGEMADARDAATLTLSQLWRARVEYAALAPDWDERPAPQGVSTNAWRVAFTLAAQHATVHNAFASEDPARVARTLDRIFTQTALQKLALDPIASQGASHTDWHEAVKNEARGAGSGDEVYLLFWGKHSVRAFCSLCMHATHGIACQ
jgi:RNA binding exosome subunit